MGREGRGGRGGGGVDQHSTWKGSVKTLEGSPLTMLILGGRSTINLERICEDFGRITSDNADLGGGRLTLNLERIHKDFGRITSDNADLGGSINTQLGSCHFLGGEGGEGRGGEGGSIDTQLGSCHFLGGEGGEGRGGEGDRSTLNLERIREDFGRITSDNADLGGSINTQLGKDPWRLWKDHL